ncbi:hypothetical protein BAUCODRAFT_35868 [Baudoinia panamericana UAMH 10762]|uniref:Uncharacterized protein n=1 Tax=Baudoinia panamericana (strain UAMH 10762) TaxID=717646 RepID=M2MDL4_BAUPA|nr:uncharacterized protein BAUCODRAFT_35868 [Baudoinia panamericana UAMH 10762]EMC94636.1 hypothetical protein BAUCODRAFT_35868 [Baudoinia panamericana UAMH 10762]
MRNALTTDTVKVSASAPPVGWVVYTTSTVRSVIHGPVSARQPSHVPEFPAKLVQYCSPEDALHNAAPNGSPQVSTLSICSGCTYGM